MPVSATDGRVRNRIAMLPRAVWWMRRWRTLVYWLTAVGFAQALLVGLVGLIAFSRL